MSRLYSDDAVVLLATLIAIVDLLFILLFVPESLKTPGKGVVAHEGGNALLDRCQQGSDPFFIFRFLRDDQTILRLSAIVFLSYLPEAGQFSCFFVYLRLVGIFKFILIFINFRLLASHQKRSPCSLPLWASFPCSVRPAFY